MDAETWVKCYARYLQTDGYDGEGQMGMGSVVRCARGESGVHGVPEGVYVCVRNG